MAWTHYVSPRLDARSREVRTKPSASVIKSSVVFLDWRVVSICSSLVLALAMGLFMTDLSQHLEIISWRAVLAASIGVGVVSLLWLWKANPARSLQRAFVMTSLLTVAHFIASASKWEMAFEFANWGGSFNWGASEPGWTVVGLIAINIVLLGALKVESTRT